MFKTLHDVIQRLSAMSSSIKALNLQSRFADCDLIRDFPDMYNLANKPQALHEVATTVYTLIADQGLPQGKLPALLHPFFNNGTFYGAYHELRTYRWLNYSGAEYEPQPTLAPGTLLNQGSGPSDLDGCFTYAEVYFDIKSFGFEYATKEAFRDRLSRELKAKVIIDGSMNNAIEDINAAFRSLNTIVEDLRESGRASVTDLDWDIRTPKPDENVTIETTWTNVYQTAKENGYYPLIHAKQFVRNRPFLLIFAFDHVFNGPLHVHGDDADVLFRSICRRTFMQSRTDHRSASAVSPAFAKRIDGSMLISDIAALLSAVLFINVQDRKSWLYINPNAVNPISRHRVDEIFNFDFPPKMHYDDFLYDNY